MLSAGSHSARHWTSQEAKKKNREKENKRNPNTSLFLCYLHDHWWHHLSEFPPLSSLHAALILLISLIAFWASSSAYCNLEASMKKWFYFRELLFYFFCSVLRCKHTKAQHLSMIFFVCDILFLYFRHRTLLLKDLFKKPPGSQTHHFLWKFLSQELVLHALLLDF